MFIIAIIVAGICLLLLLGLNSAYVPQPLDEGLRLEDPITKTEDFDGTSFDGGDGFAASGVGMPMAAAVNITALDKADANETYKFVLQESDDDQNWSDAGPIIAVTDVGFVCVPGFVSKRHRRLTLDVNGTTPSITYEAWLTPNCC